MKKAVVVLFIASLVVGSGFVLAQSVVEKSNTAKEVEHYWCAAWPTSCF